MNRTALVCTSMMSIALLGAAALVTAGPLDPPAGPVSPTHKTLTEVEPRIAINAVNTPGDADSLFKITQPGSYYLTGNVTGASGFSGIEIAASNVTVDLGGFALIGVPGSGSGILRSNPAVNDIITVKNGSVVGWGAQGLNMGLASPSTNRGSLIESVIASGNTLDGFGVPDGAVVANCVSTRNGASGFEAGNNATYIGCVAQSNAGDGFGLGFGMILTDCCSRANGGAGFVANLSTLANCSASSNTVDGYVLTRCSLTSCSASFNTLRGFRLSASTLSACSATDNAAGGILATNDNTVINCSIVGGTVGIDITVSDNRVDGCNVSDCTTGIRAASAGNFIVRNAVSGGTEYSIVAGNSAGPVVTAAGMAALTNPMANFEY